MSCFKKINKIFSLVSHEVSLVIPIRWLFLVLCV